MMIAIVVITAASVLLYLWRRRVIDAVLVLLAGAALGLLAHGVTLPADSTQTLALDSDKVPASLAHVSALTLKGAGLRAAQWQDLPARPLHWQAPEQPTLRLDFPRQLPRGRMFKLSVQRTDATSARVELLDENGRLLAHAQGEGDLTVEWLPPLAEALVLKARLTTLDGKLLAEGPVPLLVGDSPALQVSGRFGAPSFDLRVLNDLLTSSGALLDWQVTLGKTVTRRERARDDNATPDLLLIDAAWFERAAATERSALLVQVARGATLLILGANASDAGLWSRTLGLALQAQAATRHAQDALALPSAALAPASAQAGLWQGSEQLLWRRDWQQGRIGWLATSDWHRHAITDPLLLARWWQGVLDTLGVERAQAIELLTPEEMPLPDQRLAICARGVTGQVTLPALAQTLHWQRRNAHADASCVAVWPRAPGWLHLQGEGWQSAVYVYAPTDWLTWQAAERRDASTHYAARTPLAAQAATRSVPAWPFGLLFMAAMLILWWRERR